MVAVFTRSFHWYTFGLRKCGELPLTSEDGVNAERQLSLWRINAVVQMGQVSGVGESSAGSLLVRWAARGPRPQAQDRQARGSLELSIAEKSAPGLSLDGGGKCPPPRPVCHSA